MLCAAGARVAVDSTFATPLLQRPLELGADVLDAERDEVHRRALGPAARASSARATGAAERLRHARAQFGATPGALEAFLALRGLRTLPVRLERLAADGVDAGGAAARASGGAARCTTRGCGRPGPRACRAASWTASARCSRSSCAAAPTGRRGVRARRGLHARQEPRRRRELIDRRARSRAPARRRHCCASASAASTPRISGATSRRRSRFRSRAGTRRRPRAARRRPRRRRRGP